MKIMASKKLVSLIIAGGLCFSSCEAAYGSQINTDVMDLDKLLSEVENKTVTDEVLDYVQVYVVNPITLNGKLVDLDEASYDLDKKLKLAQKLDEMGIKGLDESDPYYYMVNEAATWSTADAYDFIDDIYYNSIEMKKVAIKRLSYYRTYLDKDLEKNGIDIALSLLDGSVKSRFLDNYDDSYLNVAKISYDGDKVVFNDKMYEDETESLELIRELRELKEKDNKDYTEVKEVLDKAMNSSKNIIYNGIDTKDNKVKVK